MNSLKLVLCAGAIVALMAGRAMADLVLSAPVVVAAPGSSGSFDLLISNTNAAGGADYDIAALVNELSVSGSGVNFTGVSIDTVTPYLLNPSATTAGSDFTFSIFPGSQLETFDFLLTLGAATISPGESFGVANVTYSIDAGATTASHALDWGPDTSASDAAGSVVPFDVLSGSVNVVVPAPVPAPATAPGVLILVATGLLLRWLRDLFGRSRRQAHF